jgi:hypothetical protein
MNICSFFEFLILLGLLCFNSVNFRLKFRVVSVKEKL